MTLLIQCTLINGATVKVVDNLISRLLLSLYILERIVGFYIMQQVLESTFPQQIIIMNSFHRPVIIINPCFDHVLIGFWV